MYDLLPNLHVILSLCAYTDWMPAFKLQRRMSVGRDPIADFERTWQKRKSRRKKSTTQSSTQVKTPSRTHDIDPEARQPTTRHLSDGSQNTLSTTQSTRLSTIQSGKPAATQSTTHSTRHASRYNHFTETTLMARNLYPKEPEDISQKVPRPRKKPSLSASSSGQHKRSINHVVSYVHCVISKVTYVVS